MMMLFSTDLCAVAISRGLYCLLLNMQLREALRCFGEVNDYDVKTVEECCFFTLDQFQVTESTEKLSTAPGQTKFPTQDEGEEYSVDIFLFKLILVPNERILEDPRRSGREGIRKPERVSLTEGKDCVV